MLINNGKISAGNNSKILISCNKFENNGEITPNPVIIDTPIFHDVTNYLGHKMLSAKFMRIDLLMCYLKMNESTITNKNVFWQQMGLKMDSNTLSLIILHPLLLQRSQKGKRSVLD
eukprot:344743_1